MELTVESLQGSQLNVQDAVFALQLDGKGGVRPLEDSAQVDKDNPCWLHLNYSNPDSAKWLETTPLLPNSARDALAGESTRPRVSRLGEGTLLTLRCINGSTDERPDQMVAMRVYMDERMIISTRQRRVLALDDVVNDLNEGTGPLNCGAWLVDVCDAMTDHSNEFIEDLHDRIIDLEDNLLDQQIPPRGFLALTRKQLIVMRRYMAPQRDVYARLASERLSWMDDDQRRRMQDIADRLGRGLDEIDGCIARTAVMTDEISQVMQESLTRRSYTMSLMAMVFLPSTFLTGLFGVNLGGIPGGSWPMGFSLFCIMLVVLIGGVTWWLHKSKWL
ncbi:zinc transporter ZntB [Shimwellia pseudoproteus]|uniref:zinc transporter ZntB n=1 Tax=Shimwellia pseudoproteus TaxID=570012 RepID=UPI001E634F13|nr:zinc transporter ZntB [Shimwellia pseudoproteus]